jgi:hypothetical protein
VKRAKSKYRNQSVLLVGSVFKMLVIEVVGSWKAVSGFLEKKSVRRQRCEVYIEHAELIMEDA